MTTLDGNALAGIFASTTGWEITAAIGRCRACSAEYSLARAHAHLTAMGAVMRCAQCRAVLGVLVSTPRETVVNLSGLSQVRWHRGPEDS